VRAGRRRTARRDDMLAPTAERRARGLVERSPRAIADEAGRPARPYRAVDVLTSMLRKATISPAMHQAAEDFRALFATAHLDPLCVPDLRRPRDAAKDLPLTQAQAEARKKIWHALEALGGATAPAGSCVWHVVGCEWTIRDWALLQGLNGRKIRLETASGILVGALSALQAHFGL